MIGDSWQLARGMEMESKGFPFSTAMLIICVIFACNRSSCIRTMIMTCVAARK